VVPYIDLLIKNGLAERIEGEHLAGGTRPAGRRRRRTLPGFAGADAGDGRRGGGRGSV